MLKAIWKKMLALNTGIVLLGVALFSPKLIGLQFSTGTALSRSLAIFFTLAFLALAIWSNVKIVFSKKNKPVVSERKVVGENKRLKDYVTLLKDYSNKRSFYRDMIEKAISQIDSFYEKKASLAKVVERNNLDPTLINNAMDSVETTISSNLRVFLNYLEISHEQDSDEFALMQTALRNNKSLLEGVQKLLQEVARMKGKAKLEGESLNLKTTIDALQKVSRQYYPEQSELAKMRREQQ